MVCWGIFSIHTTGGNKKTVLILKRFNFFYLDPFSSTSLSWFILVSRQTSLCLFAPWNSEKIACGFVHLNTQMWKDTKPSFILPFRLCPSSVRLLWKDSAGGDAKYIQYLAKRLLTTLLSAPSRASNDILHYWFAKWGADQINSE